MPRIICDERREAAGVLIQLTLGDELTAREVLGGKMSRILKTWSKAEGQHMARAEGGRSGGGGGN